MKINKIEQCKETNPPIEYKFTMQNMWSRKLFAALLRRYNIKPYRYYRQRYTTVMAKVSETFVDKTLWPQFLELDKELTAHLNDTAEKIINERIPEKRMRKLDQISLNGSVSRMHAVAQYPPPTVTQCRTFSFCATRWCAPCPVRGLL